MKARLNYFEHVFQTTHSYTIEASPDQERERIGLVSGVLLQPENDREPYER